MRALLRRVRGDAGNHEAGVTRDVRDTTVPINGLRHPIDDPASGWFLWVGSEFPTDDDAFVPLHVSHLSSWRPEVLPYLGLGPGWRFLLAPGYEDVWFDEALLGV